MGMGNLRTYAKYPTRNLEILANAYGFKFLNCLFIAKQTSERLEV